jgi:4-amino-4-deoxy-L-arabinose transferase-like glycosyltransferase
MDETPHTESKPSLWRDLRLLLLLLLLAAGLRIWVLWHTEVPSRDSIGFIRYALEFEKLPWPEVLQRNHQHPGYPLLLWAVSLPVRQQLGATDCDTMQLSAQLASALAGWLLVIPMFYLGRYLFDSGVGFWGALLFQCLPVSGQLLSDGLSEALYLFLLVTTLLAGVYAVRTSQPWRYVLCGVLCGLTYLTRPEGALVLAAVVVLLLLMQLAPAWRRPWRRLAVCGGSLVASAALVGSPYVLATGGLTNKPTSRMMLGQEPEAHTEAPAPRILFASVFAVWMRGNGTLTERMIESLQALASEVIHCYHYVGVLPALLGLWWFRRSYGGLPGFWLLAILCAMLVAVLWRMAVVVHYVSDRHVLLLVLLGTYPAVAFVRELPRIGERLAGRQLPGPAVLWPVLLLLVLIGSGLPRTLQTLHGNRANYHAAGRWLAEHAIAADVVLDDHAWAAYYAGRLFLEGMAVVAPPGYEQKKYAVIGRGKERNPFSTPRTVTEEQMKREGGEIVWPRGRPQERADVVVWAAPLKKQ